MGQTIVITGANRGIGLAMVQAWCARGDTVLATCRQPSAALLESGAKVIDGVDVGSADGVMNLQNALDDRRVDML